MTVERLKYPRRLVAGLLAGLSVLVVAGTWLYRSQQDAFRSAAIEKLTLIGELKANQIAIWRGERLADAAVLTEGPLLAEGVGRWIEEPTAENAFPLLGRFQGLRTHFRYSDVVLVDVEGHPLLSLSGSMDALEGLRDVLGTALQERRPVLTEIHRVSAESEPRISVVAPIFVHGGQDMPALGAVVLVSDASQFLYPLVQSWPTPSRTAETTLSRRDGDHVLFLNNLRHQPGAALSLRIPLSRTDVPAVMAVLGHEGVVEGPDYRDVKVVSVVRPIPGSPWFMVAKQDNAEVFAGWRLRGGAILGTSAALVLGLVGIGLLAWQRQEKKLFRTLYASEAQLRAAAERNSITLRSIGDAVIATDAQGRVEMLNPVAEALTGWTESEASGRPLEDVFRIVNEKTRETVANPVDKVIREGRIVGLANHTVLIARDGSERPITDSAAPIRDEEDQRMLGVVLVFRDQTSENNYRSLFQKMLDGFACHEILCDADGQPVDYRFLDVNPAFEKMTGLEARNIVGKTVSEVLPRTEKHWIETYGRVALTGETVHFSNYAKALDKHFEVTAYRSAPGQFVTIFQDVTDVKHAEAEHERLMAAIEQGGEAVVIADTEGTIQYVNRAFEEVTGYSRHEAIGKNPRILQSGLQSDDFYRKMWDTLTAGEVFKGRMLNKCKDGSFYTEDSTIAPVCDSAGNIVNYVAVKRDITEYLQLQERLLQAQKMESVGRLAGGVAHDFNNMLGAILGNAELALDSLAPDVPARADLQEIIKAANRSADITRQLLAFARKQIIAPRVLDLNETVSGMLKMLRRLIGENIDLAWVPSPGSCRVHIDPSQVDQLLANLCVNARDAISDVGKVTIETGLARLDEAYCSDHPDAVAGSYVVLTVSDNGRGMEPDTLEHLFEPFYTTKEVGKGTGLGLATVHGVVRQNNGFVNVYSEPGYGTSFKVYLPSHAGAADSVQAEDETSMPPGQGETVLIVEDEATLLKMGAAMLRGLGYRVLEAATPVEAVGIAEANAGSIRLLMTDVVMPGMNGRILAKTLKDLIPDLRCLFMSGYTANVIAHHGVLDKGVVFLQKPFSRQDLARHLRKALGDG